MRATLVLDVLSRNKYEKMYEIIAAAFQVLRFERFLDKQEDVEEIIDTIKKERLKI